MFHSAVPICGFRGYLLWIPALRQSKATVLELLYCYKSAYYIKIPQASAHFQNIVIFFKIVHSQPVRCNSIAFYSSYTIGPPKRLNTNPLTGKLSVGKLLLIGQRMFLARLSRQVGVSAFVVLGEPLVARVQTYVEVLKPVLVRREVLFQHPVVMRLSYIAIA